MTMATHLYLIGTYSVRGLVHYPPNRDHGGTQANMVAESSTS